MDGSIKVQDLIILGSGPAALTAALYAARDGIAVNVYEKSSIGGTISQVSHIENYPGFAGTGAELMQQMRAQAEQFGAKINYGECQSVSRRDDGNYALSIDSDEVISRAVIVATGTDRRKLGIPGETLPGVSYCATCDGPLTKGEDVIVIGGGNAAAQEALYLLKFCGRLKILVRSTLKCDEELKKRLLAEPRVEIICGFVPSDITRQDILTIKNAAGDTYQAGRIFIYIGAIPATSFLPTELLAADGAVRTDEQLETAWPGVFAAGDCRDGAIRQAVIAAGEGAAAAIGVRHYLDK